MVNFKIQIIIKNISVQRSISLAKLSCKWCVIMRNLQTCEHYAPVTLTLEISNNSFATD